jgi:hypothetical protein
MIECIDCGSDKIEANGRCASCNHAQRKVERESKKVKIFKKPNLVSEKKAAELKEYNKLKKQYLESKMACEMKFQGCSISAMDIHHTSLSATNFLNINTWVGCCRFCHTVCENMPAQERRELGLLTD